jgi:hypothetical protein
LCAVVAFVVVAAASPPLVGRGALLSGVRLCVFVWTGASTSSTVSVTQSMLEAERALLYARQTLKAGEVCACAALWPGSHELRRLPREGPNLFTGWRPGRSVTGQQ